MSLRNLGRWLLAVCLGGLLACGPGRGAECGPCQRRSQVGGACEVLPAGASAVECAASDQSTCGLTGLCTGTGACALFPDRVVCAQPSCTGGSTLHLADRCDGNGQCAPGGAEFCAYFSCGAGCAPVGGCIADAQCGPRVCREQRCVGTVGAACTSGDDCESRTCCGGLCVAPLADPADCALCAASCSLAHAILTCTATTCGILQCEAGWSDCDGDAANGCEAELGTLEHCGSCTPCAAPHASSQCRGGACTLVTCDAGYVNCDGDASTGCETVGAACPGDRT